MTTAAPLDGRQANRRLAENVRNFEASRELAAGEAGLD